MIKLSERLSLIASFVDKEDNIIDIGCDHALLDIYLVKKLSINKIIASDIVKEAIDSAKITINKYGIINNIDLRVGDGLNVLKEEDFIDTIIISGLGCYKIIKILKDNINVLKNVNKLIIQPNNLYGRLRKNVIKLGYYIEDEKIVKEKNIFYTIIVFKKGKKKYNKYQIKCGPILIKNKDKLLIEYINIEIKSLKLLLNCIPNKNIIRRIKINRELNILNKVKKHLNS